MTEKADAPEILGLEDDREETGSDLPVLKADATDQEIEEFFEHGRLRVVQERNDFFLPHVVDFIEGRKWGNLRPEYQRRLRWDRTKKSRLIESFIMNVPVPPVFLYEKSIGSFEVMDGQQRLGFSDPFTADLGQKMLDENCVNASSAKAGANKAAATLDRYLDDRNDIIHGLGASSPTQAELLDVVHFLRVFGEALADRAQAMAVAVN